jgi:hypothetical protein
MTLSALGIFSAAGAGGVVAGAAYELIESFVVTGSSTTSVTFSSLGTYSSTYKHLQLRMTARTDRATVVDYVRLRFNGDSGSNYAFHNLSGSALGGVTSNYETGTQFNLLRAASANSSANIFGAITTDILDAYSTTKNKVTRTLGGVSSSTSSEIVLASGLWSNTASITSIFCGVGGGTNFVAGSRFSLYGIRG